MTSITDTNPPAGSVLGPYSRWPRRKGSRRRTALVAAGTGAAAVFVHCVVPLIGG